MIPGENKYKWANEPIQADICYDGNRFEVVRNGEEMLFIPIPAFIAIVKLCKEKYPHMLKDEQE